LSFTKGSYGISNRNPGGIKRKGIEVLNHKHPFPMSYTILCNLVRRRPQALWKYLYSTNSTCVQHDKISSDWNIDLTICRALWRRKWSNGKE